MKVKDIFYISWLSEAGEENRRQEEQINPKKMKQVLPKVEKKVWKVTWAAKNIYHLKNAIVIKEPKKAIVGVNYSLGVVSSGKSVVYCLQAERTDRNILRFLNYCDSRSIKWVFHKTWKGLSQWRLMENKILQGFVWDYFHNIVIAFSTKY